MINFFSNIFGYVLNLIYGVVSNYGLAIILFSVLIKIVMLPLSIKQEKTLKKNQKIQEEMKIIQIKHNGNQEKINQEMMDLYKREKMNPFGGCFSIIIQFILLFAMFYLVRSPLTYMKKVNSETIENQKTQQELMQHDSQVFGELQTMFGISQEDTTMNTEEVIDMPVDIAAIENIGREHTSYGETNAAQDVRLMQSVPQGPVEDMNK